MESTMMDQENRIANRAKLKAGSSRLHAFGQSRPGVTDCPLPSVFFLLHSAFMILLFSGACVVGPKYQRPTAPVPPAYKEQPPDNSKGGAAWKPAQPNDGTVRGKWWEIYNDPQLNALEEQVSISNQNVLAAEAQFREAKDTVRIVRSGLFPTVTALPSIVNSRTSSTLSSNGLINSASGVRTTYNLPVDVSYQADVWGSIRRSVSASAAAAQVSAAQLENARLIFQSELAQDYFQLHGADSDQDLLERTVKSYEQYLQLTKNRYNGGVASGGDVAQAEAQLDTARAQLIDLGVARAQFEHAIAILIGKSPAALSISSAIIKSPPPPIPVGVPSELLERRPDIAAAERQMAAANEQIGIAKAAFYPALLLSASGGLESTSFLNWISWPSRFWSVGPQLAETLFDAGKRRAQLAQTQAAYDFTVAGYRQTVLTSFQQVEDNLAALRVLANEASAVDDAVRAAERSLQISTDQYKAGTVSYLQVITSQAIALQDERTAVDVLTRRMVASVHLVEALGGGWDASTLPTEQKLIKGN
jgi:NodT family efflux transporter outer membrane factor (OMF) lipoprotein